MHICIRYCVPHALLHICGLTCANVSDEFLLGFLLNSVNIKELKSTGHVRACECSDVRLPVLRSFSYAFQRLAQTRNIASVRRDFAKSGIPILPPYKSKRLNDCKKFRFLACPTVRDDRLETASRKIRPERSLNHESNRLRSGDVFTENCNSRRMIKSLLPARKSTLL